MFSQCSNWQQSLLSRSSVGLVYETACLMLTQILSNGADPARPNASQDFP